MASLLHEDTLLKARNELNEIPEEKQGKIDLLRSKILSAIDRNKLPWNARVDDRMLVRYLRPKKFDVEKALKLCINYHRLRERLGEDRLSYQSVKTVLDSGIFDLPEGRGTDGSQGFIMYLTRWDTSQFTVIDLVCATLFILEALLDKYEDLEIHGFRLLADFADYTFIQQLKTQAMLLGGGRSLLIEVVEVAYPMRVKGLETINQAWYVNALMMMFRPFLSQKLKDRLILHGRNYEEIHRVFDPETLPISLGGTQCALSTLTELLKPWQCSDIDTPISPTTDT